MTKAFMELAIPVLAVYDDDAEVVRPPSFDVNILPIVSRVLKNHWGTDDVTVISGTPVPPSEVDTALTDLALRASDLKRADPSASAMVLCELIMENFDADLVKEKLDELIRKRDDSARDLVEP